MNEILKKKYMHYNIRIAHKTHQESQLHIHDPFRITLKANSSTNN